MRGGRSSARRSSDPDCALAGWGRAMSWLPVDPWRMSQQALREGRDAVRRAAGRGTPREQAYVNSAAALFDDPSPASEPSYRPARPAALPSRLRRPRQTSAPAPGQPSVPIGTRLGRYRDATRNLAAEFVDDQVAAIVFARATLLLSTVPGDDSAREAAAIIERRVRRRGPQTAAQSAAQTASEPHSGEQCCSSAPR